MKSNSNNLKSLFVVVFCVALLFFWFAGNGNAVTIATYSISAPGDDTYQNNTGGINAFNYAQSQLGIIFLSNSNYSGYFRWPINIPANAAVTYSYISVRSGNGSGGNFSLYVYLIDSANCPNLSTASPYQLATSATYVIFPAGASWNNGTWYNSPEITDLVREFVSKPGYTPGNYLGLKIGQPATGWLVNYYRYIRQYDYDSTINSSAKLVVYYNQNPNATTLISPLDKTTTTSHLPTFSWNSVSDPDGDPVTYQVQLAADAGFSSMRYQSSFSSATVYTPPAELATGFYYWRVISQDTSLATNTSVAWTLTMLNRRPEAVNLIEPPNTTITYDHAPTFIWSLAADPDGDQVRYLIQVDNNSTFNGLEYQNTLFAAVTEAMPLTDLPTDFYYWRVISFDNSWAENTSPVWTLSMLNRPPNQPTLISPLDQSSTLNHDPLFVWTGSDPDPGDVVKYQIEVDDNIDFSSPQFQTSFATTYNAIRGSEFVTGTYYWRVIAQDTSLAQNTSDIGTVYILNRPPTAATLIAPSISTTNNRFPIFSWNSGSDPDLGDSITYRLQVWAETSAIDTSLLTDTTFVTTAALSANRYNWRVISLDSSFAANTSTTSWFIAFDTTQQRVLNSVSTSVFYLGTWDSSTDYTPVTFSINTITGIDTVTITVFDAKHPNATDTTGSLGQQYFLSRWYRIESNGSITAANLKLVYTEADYADAGFGLLPETEMKFANDNSGIWTWFNASARDTAMNRIELDEISSLTDWTLMIENRPPNAVSLIQPMDLSSTLNHTPLFAWNPATDPDGNPVYYRIQVDNNSDFSSPEFTSAFSDATESMPSPELSIGTYYWQVISQDTLNAVNTSSVWTVTILNRPPDAVNLIEPTNSTSTSNHTPTFIWSDATDPDGNSVEYSLQVDNNIDFSSPEYEVAFGNATESTPGTELGTGFYYWRVISRDSLGETRTSAVWTLTLENRAPAAVTLISPLDATTTSNHIPVFEWNAATDPDAGDTLEYKVQVDDDVNFASLNYENTFGTATQDTPASEFPTGLYYFRVISRDTSGAENTSAVWSINILNRPPTAVSLISPLDTSTSSTHQPQFIWSEATDPDAGDTLEYKIEVDTNPSFSSPIYQNSFGSATEAIPGTDLPNGTLYWRVICQDTSLATNTSVTWTITFENRPPNAISLLTPTISTTNNRTPEFIWAGGDPDPGDEVNYRLQVWADAGFAIDTSIVTDTACLSPVTLTANRYNWRVIGEDASFAVVTSATSWFIAFDTTQQRKINGVSTAIFYLGTWNSSTDYTPVTLSMNSVLGSDTVTIAVFDERHPNISSYNYLTRWYRIEMVDTTNIAEANIRFSYTDADFEDANYGVVPESEIKVAKWDGISWSIPALTLLRDTVLNRVDILGVTSFSDWTLMIDNQEPFAVTLIQPENSSTTVNRTPLFAWNTTTDPEGSNINYRIQVDNNINFSSPEFITSFTDATEAVPGTDLNPGTYYWRVICEDTVHAVNTSARWTVTILNQNPEAVSLLQPADSSIGSNHTPIFVWNPATDSDGDIVTYQIQVDNDSGFGSPEYTSGFGIETTATPGTDLASGTYYWRVISQDPWLATNTSATWSITIENRAPAASSLIQPADGSNSADHMPLFAWNPAIDPDSDAVTYAVQVDNDSGFGSPEYSSGFGIATTATPGSPLATGTYYWRVISQDGSFAANTSAVWSVILENQAPNAVSLVSPLSGTTTNNQQPTFSWQLATDPDGDAVTYQIQVDNDPGFGSPEFSSGFASAISATPSSALATGTYYWRVISQDPLLAQNISAVWTVTIENQAPDAVSLVSPISGTTTSNRQPLFKWNPAIDPEGDAVTYQVELSTDPGFGSLAYSSGFSSGTSATPSSMLAFGTYYWRVISQDPLSAQNISAVWMITIQGSGTTAAPLFVSQDNTRSTAIEFSLDMDTK